MTTKFTIMANLEREVFKEMKATMGVRALQNTLLLTTAKVLIPIIRRNTPIYSGDTQADIRAKVVDRNDLHIAKVIVGIDARKGHAGWYTHFIRTKGSRKRNDFIERSVEQSKSLFEFELESQINRMLEKHRQKIAL